VSIIVFIRKNSSVVLTPALESPDKMPSKEEWEYHHETIYRIYMTEGKPLRELMAEMEKKYGFSATYVLLWQPIFLCYSETDI